jgi:signal transduction histidine kinase
MMKQRFSGWLAVLALTAVLITLAILQYRWSSQVSAATRSQMEANLQSSLMGFRQDLARELGAVCVELRSAADDSGSVRIAEFSRQFVHWQQTTAHPGLVKQLYLWRSGGHASLLRLDPTREELDSAGWPEGWDRLRQRMSEMSSPIVRPVEGMRHIHVRRRPGFSRGVVVNPFLPWFVDESIPALVYPLRKRAGDHGNDAKNAAVTWIIVQLDRDTVEKEILPELAQKYFRGSSGFDYHVAVLSGGKDGALYSSDAGFAQNADSTHDPSVNLFGMPFHRPPLGPPGGQVFAMFRTEGGPRVQDGPDRRYGGPDRWVPIEPLYFSGDAATWQLVVRHKKGSLEAAVANLHQRQLLLSFGVLLVLAVTMAMVLIASQRARRLAALQMGFVAGVSHELRTPLAVISSAAENIAHGVVADPTQVSCYGASILKQARQLTHLVEQVLLFASTQQKAGNYQLVPVPVDEAIDAALENTAGLAKTAGIAVERRVEAGLPPVAADFSALSQVLQNLITNAIKYGGGGHWLGITASARRENGVVAGIDITVSDKGPGIAAAEIKHIFQPFYRSPSVAGSNVHGTGLGLPLARTIVEAMRGRLTVASEPGQGSAFTIHLAIAAASALAQGEVASGGIPHPSAGYTP